MTANSKWITIESLDEPVTRVARRAIKARLRWMWSRFPLAAESADEDIEHVHQLRVATRRAHAAMETFAAYLPPRRAEWFDRQLKRIRHAAAEARDLDVLAIRLHRQVDAEPSAAGTAILNRIAEARHAAQPEIIEVYQRLLAKDFRKKLHKLLRRIRLRPPCSHQPGEAACECGSTEQVDSATEPCSGECSCQQEPTVALAARSQMRQLVDAWFCAAEADLSDTHRLHLFRIAGKRVRYAMEIFAAALGSNCRKTIYPQVVEILEHLGQINDHVSSEARFQLWLNDTDDPEQRTMLTRLLAADAAAISARLHEFFQVWTPERRERMRGEFADELADA